MCWEGWESGTQIYREPDRGGTTRAAETGDLGKDGGAYTDPSPDSAQDCQWSTGLQTIAQALDVALATIYRVRQRCVEEGVEAAITARRPRRDYRRKLDGDQEAHLIALVCGQAPEGHARWSLRLLANSMVELGYVDSVSHETVRGTLEKTNSSPGETSSGSSRPRPWGLCEPHGRGAGCLHQAL